MNKKRKLFATFLMAFMLAIVGCAAFQDSITPCYIPPECVTATGADVPRLWFYTTITDAQYVGKKLDWLKEDLTTHIANAKQFKQIVFDPQGPLGLLLPALTGLGLGSMLISKPEDKKRIVELEKKLNGNA